MTLSEFKAWFEGFTEGMGAAPDEDQWKRIKARVAEINGAATRYPVFIDRYVEPYRRYWPSSVPYWSAGSASGQGVAPRLAGDGFNSTVAMFDLGKAEYTSALNG